MRYAFSHSRALRRTALALAVVAGTIGCSGTTDPPPAWATLTLVSGDKQTVTMGAETLTDFPQLVVVHLDSLGTPIANGDLSVAVQMNGAPGPNGPYAFTTGSEGTASMQLVVSNIPGPVVVEVSYVRCVREGLFTCAQERTFAMLALSAVAVR